MLVSVHLPKTAGISFLEAIKPRYAGSLLRDYADRPMHKESWQRRLDAVSKAVTIARSGERFARTQCIHGHFMPLKYRFLPNRGTTQYVVWLRDPVERLGSHYHFWKRDYDPATAGILRRRVVEENWSFERFCLGPEMRNLYSEFLWGFPLELFDFIGLTEFYHQDLAYFGESVMGEALATSFDNTNLERGSERYVEDPALRDRILAHHARDVVIYEKARQLREHRLATI